MVPLDSAKERREPVTRDVGLGSETEQVFSCRDAAPLRTAHQSYPEEVVAYLVVFVGERDDFAEGLDVIVFCRSEESWFESFVTVARHAGAGPGHCG